MVQRFLYRPDGTLRRGRLTATLGATIALAIFGTSLLVLAPRVADSAFGRGAWVMFAVVVLKFPLIAILWSFIRRNAEWPGRPVVWSDAELAAILQRLDNEAARAADHENATLRLAHLSTEVWAIADRVSGEAKADALRVALRIDELRMARNELEAPG